MSRRHIMKWKTWWESPDDEAKLTWCGLDYRTLPEAKEMGLLSVDHYLRILEEKVVRPSACIDCVAALCTVILAEAPDEAIRVALGTEE